MPDMMKPGLVAEEMGEQKQEAQGGGAFVEEKVPAGDKMQSAIANSEGQLSPEQIAQLEAYSTNATKMVFSEKTQPAILQELQSGANPIESIALTANHLHKLLQDSLEKTGEQMTDQTMFLGASHLVSELTVLAEAAGIFVLDNTQKMDALQFTIQKFFEVGLNNGTIDPVELQKELEPLMTPEQKQYGMMKMAEGGLSKTAPPSGKMWFAKDKENASRQAQQTQQQPASAEVPAGLLGQGGM